MESWVTFAEETVSLAQILARWSISSYTLIDIIKASIDIDDICRLRPYLKQIAPFSLHTANQVAWYKALSVDINALRQVLLIAPDCERIVFKASHIERAEHEGIAPIKKTASTSIPGNCFSKKPETVEALKAELAQKDVSLSEREKELAAFRQAPASSPSVSSSDEGAWEDSVTAVCKAVLFVVSEGRNDWVSGQDKNTGDTDSAGLETFRALLQRMHPTPGKRCRVKAENAAWKVLVEAGFTHKGSRKAQNS